MTYFLYLVFSLSLLCLLLVFIWHYCKIDFPDTSFPDFLGFFSCPDRASEEVGYQEPPVEVVYQESPAETFKECPEEADKVSAEEAAKESPEEADKVSPEEVDKESAEEAAKESAEEAAKESAEDAAKESAEEAAKESAEEAAKESPEEADKESPEEVDKESPEEAVKESPEEAAQESPEEAAKESPEETAKESPEEVDKESPEEAVKEPPEEAAKEPTEEAAKEPPEEAVKEPPEEAAKEPTEEATKESPEEVAKEPPEEAVKEPPEEAAKEPTEEAAKESPEEAAKESPDEAAKESPEEAVKESPEEAVKESPEDAAKESPEEAAKESPEETAGTPENGQDQPTDSSFPTVCQESDISENGMKVCDLGTDDGKVLLIKQNGKIYAIGNNCTHYEAPLETGALGNGRVRCPWHGACFNIKTGDIEDFPGLDSLPSYKVEIDSGGGVKVHAKKTYLKRIKNMSRRDPNNDVTFVIIGGGPAGQVCAETLRQERFTGRLILVSAELFPPYDRIRLSKKFDITIDEIQLRPDAFYKEYDIELILSTKVVNLDIKQKLLTLSNEKKLNYSSVFIATGSIPRKLTVPGSDLRNIFTLRSLSDAKEINKVLTPKSQVVILGASFIGMEAATYCIEVCREGSVTVIGRNAVPFSESLGEVVGKRIARMFTEKGVKLLASVTIDRLEGDGTAVTTVVLSDGTSIPANVVIAGIGNIFASDFLKNSGIALNENGSIPVSKFLETNCAGIFAGGDVAQAPVFAAGGKSLTVTHWGLAHYHGRIAALNMMSLAIPLKTVPIFWTSLFGKSFRYAGHATSYDDTVIGGNLEILEFACYYCKADQVVAVTTVGVDPLAAQYAELIYNGNTLHKKDVIENPLSWQKN